MYVVHVALRCGWTTEILNHCMRELKKHRNTNSVQLSELDRFNVLKRRVVEIEWISLSLSLSLEEKELETTNMRV